jgi:hypothetical protein
MPQQLLLVGNVGTSFEALYVLGFKGLSLWFEPHV